MKKKTHKAYSIPAHSLRSFVVGEGRARLLHERYSEKHKSLESRYNDLFQAMMGLMVDMTKAEKFEFKDDDRLTRLLEHLIETKRMILAEIAP